MRSGRPLLGAVARVCLSISSEHVIVADADATTVTQYVGLDQGCPLSPGFYSVATRRGRQRTREAMCQADPSSLVPAFLDDTCMVGRPEAVVLGRQAFKDEMAKLNLKVHPKKEKMWRASAAAPPGGDPAAPAALPASLASLEVDSLACVGATVGFARKGRAERTGEWRENTLGETGQNRDTDAWLARQDQFYARLQLRHTNGLPEVFAMDLVRTWSQGPAPTCNGPTRSRPTGPRQWTLAP